MGVSGEAEVETEVWGTHALMALRTLTNLLSRYFRQHCLPKLDSSMSLTGCPGTPTVLQISYNPLRRMACRLSVA